MNRAAEWQAENPARNLAHKAAWRQKNTRRRDLLRAEAAALITETPGGPRV